MSKKSNLKLKAVAFGALFAISLAISPAANAADNPFGMTELSKGGYMIVAGTAEHERKVKKYIRRGLDRMSEGDYHGAIVYFSRAIELGPDNPSAYFHRGRAKFEEGDYEGAIADFDQFIALDPGYAFAYTLRGDAKERLGDKQGARQDHTIADVIDYVRKDCDSESDQS